MHVADQGVHAVNDSATIPCRGAAPPIVVLDAIARILGSRNGLIQKNLGELDRDIEHYDAYFAEQ